MANGAMRCRKPVLVALSLCACSVLLWWTTPESGSHTRLDALLFLLLFWATVLTALWLPLPFVWSGPRMPWCSNSSTARDQPLYHSASQAQRYGVIVALGLGALWLGLLGRLVLHDQCPIEYCPEPLPCPPKPFTTAAVGTASNALALPGTPNRRLAIVMPFIQSQVDRLMGGLRSWETLAPCRLNDDGTVASGAKVTIVLYFDRDVDSAGAVAADDTRTIKEYFSDNWQTLPERTRSCVNGGLHFVSAKLRDEDNTHPDGPCIQQFKLHSLLVPDYDHFFQMEPDVKPIQDYWMDALVSESDHNEGCSRFWMKGSSSRCDGRFGKIAERHDYHINGNALYCLGSPGFNTYLKKVQNFYPAGKATGRTSPGCSTGKWAEDGWDHTMFQYRLQPENFDYVRHINWKFMDAPFISNMCEDDYDIDTVLRDTDRLTYLVHSKFPFLALDDQWVRRVFLRLLGRYSEPHERKLYRPPHPGDERDAPPPPVNRLAVLAQLCASPDHAAYVDSLPPHAVAQRTHATAPCVDDAAAAVALTDVYQ